MLPRETSVRQLKKLRAETKGTDIGDLTAGDRLNHNIPNLQYIGNPVDTGIDSYEDFTEKDNSLQTIAFKSKLVNKPLVKGEKKVKENMENIKKFEDYDVNDEELDEKYSDLEREIINTLKLRKRREIRDKISPIFDEMRKKMKSSEMDDKLDNSKLDNSELDDSELILQDESIKTFENFEDIEGEEGLNIKNYFKNIWSKDTDVKEFILDNDLSKYFQYIDPSYDWDSKSNRELMKLWDEWENDVEDFDVEDFDDEDFDDEEDDVEFENIKSFESFTLKEVSSKKEIQPDYAMLGAEKEPKSDPNFGYAAVRDQEIKKIALFNSFVIDPPTPKERPINAGTFIDNDIVKGYVNRIEGKDVYVESLDNPLVIKKFSLKDAVKTKK